MGEREVRARDVMLKRKMEKTPAIDEKIAVAGRVVRTLAHEVRNPLTNIFLAVEQLEEEMKTGSHAVYFDIIKRNSDRINNIIKDFLQHFSRPEVTISKHSINDLLNETITLARTRAALKNIEINTHLDTADCYVMTDREKLQTAVLNILINAIEAVEVNTGKIMISAFIADDKAVIAIGDNGPGISGGTLGHIFEPYYTSKPKRQGLGLSTAYNIIQSLNGTLDVESELEKGTRFIIHLDVKQNEKNSRN